MYLPKNLNIDAHKLIGLEKLYGSRTWMEGYPILKIDANILVSVSS